MQRRLLPLVGALLMLEACATTTAPIPEGYTGPTAHVWDTTITRQDLSFDLFYLAEVNGRLIDNSHIATHRSTYWLTYLTPKVIMRDIPAEPSRIRIVARTHQPTPLRSIVDRTDEVAGEVQFTPEPDAYYFVRGMLKNDYGAVWLENASGVLIGQKIEIKRASK